MLAEVVSQTREKAPAPPMDCGIGVIARACLLDAPAVAMVIGLTFDPKPDRRPHCPSGKESVLRTRWSSAIAWHIGSEVLATECQASHRASLAAR
jgi:hypothetical protein